MAAAITSASGIISLLEEPRMELRIFALHRLNEVVDDFWPEISDAIAKIETLYEDKRFKERQAAALLASKVYYHLGDYSDSLNFALAAGNLFDVSQSSEYVDTLIAKAIDEYTQKRLMITEPQPGTDVDPSIISVELENIVNRMFERCFRDGQYRQALGIALETRRMDILQRAIRQSDDVAGMLQYAMRVTMSLIENRHFRNDVLRQLVDLYKNLHVPDYVNMTQCLIFLDDAQSVGEVLDKLTRGPPNDALMAYQIAFDLYESATQQFLNRVLQAIRSTAPIPSLIGPEPKPTASPSAEKSEEAAPKPDGVESMETDAVAEKQPETAQPEASTSEAAEKKPEVPPPEQQREGLSDADKQLQERLEKLAIILSGETSIELQLQFLIRNNHTDMLILKQTKDAVRNSVCHTATVIANGFMSCGTTSDTFLRDNLEWLSRAVNWAKFSATASLGVIHKGHEKEALHLMSAYLPKDAGPGSGYTEGGGLYALGLIHANHGRGITDYLLNQLKSESQQSEAFRHGGCLGLGLAAMGTNRIDVYDQLKFMLLQDDAVVGEGAAIAMGLVMLGSKSPQAIQDMVGYAQDTQHEKILRGIAIGLSLLMFGRLEEADTLIETLIRDKDPLLRRSGMHTIAMAYCGTGNNKAIRKLLHVAVSDTNDDVRRAAVEAIGFILFRTPDQCPSVVSLLSESYNPHVRYGAAMALGICCAGTGNKEALGLLEPMSNDPVNYVRQGALIASALILIQQTEALCPKVKDYRALYAKVIADKHDDVMAKLGAIMAQGIIDAGGRNVTINLQSGNGHTNVAAVVGMLVFTQFWYWYPLAHFLSLAFTPTCLIGLNSDLKMPKWQVKSNAKPSLYGYPPPIEEKKEKVHEKMTTAVLSITARAKKREAEKQKEKEAEKMDVDSASAQDKPSTSAAASPAPAPAEEKKPDTSKASDGEKKTDEAASTSNTKSEEKPSEPNFEMLDNPARVVAQQLKVMEIADGSRYVPVKDLKLGGIIMLKDIKHGTGEPEDLVEPVAAGGPKKEDDQEPPPPEPFEYRED